MSTKPSLAQEPGRFPNTDTPPAPPPGPPPAMKPVPDQAPQFADGAKAPGAMTPGDEAPAGTPGTGEGVCHDCGGSGMKNGGICPTCEGRGRVIKAIGGA